MEVDRVTNISRSRVQDEENGNENENENDDGDDRFSDWDENEEDEEDGLEYKSFIDFTSFSNIELLKTYDRDNYGFDLDVALQFVDKDIISLIRVVNYLRYCILDWKQEKITIEVVNHMMTGLQQKLYLTDDKYMIPAIKNDAFLLNPERFLLEGSTRNMTADEDDEDNEDNEDNDDNSSIDLNKRKTQDTIFQLERYKILVAELTSGEETRSENSEKSLEESDYFTGYGHIGIHETMLRDDIRTKAYASALASCHMKDKIVLDVGCGSGILCLLAARAGAKKVIGIDNSNIIDIAKKIVLKNGYDSVITLIRGEIESSILPLEPEEKVDVIVSEWMGYGLLFENMLASVLVARDRFLALSGLMMPSHANIYLEAFDPHRNQVQVMENSFEDPSNSSDVVRMLEDRVNWWKDVYGFDMTDMVPLLISEAQVQEVAADLVVSNRAMVYPIDTKTASEQDLDFSVPIHLIVSENCMLRAFALSFDVLFTNDGDVHSSSPPVILSTSLQTPITHWQHVALWLNSTNVVPISKGQHITGKLSYERRSENRKTQSRREYNINLQWNIYPAENNENASSSISSFAAFTVPTYTFSQQFILK